MALIADADSELPVPFAKRSRNPILNEAVFDPPDRFATLVCPPARVHNLPVNLHAVPQRENQQ